MEQFLRVLKSLISTYEPHLSDVRAHVGVHRLTPASLPVLLILERAGYDLHSLFKYSHVCSRIRNVILGNPSLWARFTLVNKLPVPLINAFARRSGDLGLVMKIVLHESTYDWPQDKLLRVLEIFKYCHKWTSASFSINEYVAKELERRFPTGEHTLLHTLQLSDGGLTHPLPSTLFYQNWSFPALNKCNLFHQDLDLPDLIAFLASSPNLKYLDLHMRTLRNTLPKFQEVILLRLEHLKIRTSSDSSNAIGDLHEAISCPSLKCLTPSLTASDSK